MIAYTADALAQVEDLADHYERLLRVDALRNLDRALMEAEAAIERSPLLRRNFPRPYPQCERAGVLWVFCRPYWVAYLADRLLIVAVFHESGDIPGRY